MGRPIPPRIEGTVLLPDGRRLGFAEFGRSTGRPIVWLHGTPGARRQIPPEARRLADERGIRLIGLERPGAGLSTPHLYRCVGDFGRDARAAADQLGLERFAVIGLSGGGPYVLACAACLPERVVAGVILGGVAPTHGHDAPAGGIVRFASHFARFVQPFHEPAAAVVATATRALRPLSGPVYELAGLLFPRSDRIVLHRPGMKEALVDDLALAGRHGIRTLVYDYLLYSRPWGFSLDEIRVPIRFWHGDADQFVPVAHVEHMASRIPDAVVHLRHAESHLGSLDLVGDIFDEIEALWEAPGSARFTRQREPS